MKVLFICNDFRDKSDGGKIYDFKLTKAIKDLGYELDEYFVKFESGITIPFWKKKIENKELERIRLCALNYDKVIVSHETLMNVTTVIKPDLFIFHNVFSCFDSPHFLINSYYRFFSLHSEKRIIKQSKKILVLSYREKKYLEDKFPKIKFFSEPPGLRSKKPPENENFFQIKVIGSYDWFPKKKSMMSLVEKKKIETRLQIVDNDKIVITSCSLIDEDFKAGFKLKLLEFLFYGDIIFSKVDLIDEIINLGLNPGLFNKISGVEDIFKILDDENFINEEKFNEIKTLNQEKLIEKYTWTEIAKRILRYLIDE